MGNTIFIPKRRAGGFSGPPVLTYADTANSSSNLSSYTFSSHSIGADEPKFVVVCASATGGAYEITGVTVGGVSCTEHTAALNSSTTDFIGSVYVASGTTANIVVSCSGAKGRCSISTYALTNHDGTPASSGTDNETSGTSIDVAGINVATNGVVVYCTTAGASDTGAHTYSAATERADIVQEGSTQGRHSTAQDSGLLSSATETVTTGNNWVSAIMSYVVWENV